MKFTLTTDTVAHNIGVIDKYTTSLGIETFTLRLQNLDVYGLYIDPNLLLPSHYNTAEIMHLLEPWLLNMIEEGVIETDGDRGSACLHRVEFLEFPSTTVGILKVIISTQPDSPPTMPQVVSRRYNDTMATYRTYKAVRTALADHLQIDPAQLGSPRNNVEATHHQLMNCLIDASLELSGWEFYRGACKALSLEIGKVNPTYGLVETIFAHLVNFVISYRTKGKNTETSVGSSASLGRDLYAEILNEATREMIIHVATTRARTSHLLLPKVTNQAIDSLRVSTEKFIKEQAMMYSPRVIAQVKAHLQKITQFMSHKPKSAIISSIDGFVLITSSHKTESLTRGLEIFVETNAILPHELPRFSVSSIASVDQLKIQLLKCPVPFTARLAAYFDDYLQYDVNSKTPCTHQWKRLFEHVSDPIEALTPNLACNLCGATGTYAGSLRTYLTRYQLIEIVLPTWRS